MKQHAIGKLEEAEKN
ncbi:hypothetical protein NO739_29760 [Klebsiella pneumoniae]|nr:hypothetical protein [Klebsiella pneumoniae]MCQ5432061.1 hypothetical protein [Klebsiella pneumoniae]MCQ5432062.1 hypothetical protein [Klebsiella pneumoniae]